MEETEIDKFLKTYKDLEEEYPYVFNYSRIDCYLFILFCMDECDEDNYIKGTGIYRVDPDFVKLIERLSYIFPKKNKNKIIAFLIYNNVHNFF